MKKNACISNCGSYRYWLSRIWDEVKSTATFIMLNPSTADAIHDDPTIRRCINFAREWGCGGIRVVNLFAFRATNPKILKTTADPVGPNNDQHIVQSANMSDVIVAAWGTRGAYLGRDMSVTTEIKRIGHRLMCLGTTKEGFPQHPLYVPTERMLFPFSE